MSTHYILLKNRETVGAEIRERQRHQQEAAQSVVSGEEPTVVVAVREPARANRAEEIEYAPSWRAHSRHRRPAGRNPRRAG